MHVSSRNMFPTIKNLQIRVHVYHKNNCTKKKNGSHDMKDRCLNNHCQECVRAYLSIHNCLSFRHEVMIGNHRNKTTESYNGTFTKLFILFMHVSSRNMFPTIKNLQIRVHVYRPRHITN
jgi:hypothetical protein